MAARRNYTRYIDFGEDVNNQVKSPFNASNPITYCMFSTLGTQFMHGSSTSNLLYGNYNPTCESYMAQHCAQNWDGFCDAYTKMNVDTYWPNAGSIDGVSYNFAQAFLKNNKPTYGEQLVRNTVNFKFLFYPDAKKSIGPFDPNTANSPDMIHFSNLGSGPSLIKHIQNIDNNEYVSKMLENPLVCFDVIARLYLGYLRKEPTTRNFKGSKLEKYFKENQCMLDNFLNEAIPRIPSFQMLH